MSDIVTEQNGGKEVQSGSNNETIQKNHWKKLLNWKVSEKFPVGVEKKKRLVDHGLDFGLRKWFSVATHSLNIADFSIFIHREYLALNGLFERVVRHFCALCLQIFGTILVLFL